MNNCGQEVACTGCAGCCDGDVCHIDDDAACGSNGGACTNCLNDDKTCDNGSCRACDVTCAPGDPVACGNALQAKLDAGGPDTVRVCSGLYQGNFSISRGVTVIGAGQGEDPGTASILDGNLAGPVVTIADGTGTVELESLRVRNGSAGAGGGGIRHTGTLLRLRNSTVANNAATGGSGGGIRVGSGNDSSVPVAEDCTIRENTAADINDGGGVMVYGTATLTDCLVGENSANNYGGGIYIMLNATTTLAGNTTVRNNSNSSVAGSYARGTLNVGADCLITDNHNGGIAADSGEVVSLAAGALVCGNVSYQCSGFNDPAACQDVCLA